MENNAKFLTETALRISGVNPRKCMKCGKCSGTCPNYDAMEYHPHQFVAMVEKGQIEKLMQSKSIYLCLSCMACVEAVRLMQIRQQDKNHKGARDIPEFADESVPQQLLMAAMRKYRK